MHYPELIYPFTRVIEFNNFDMARRKNLSYTYIMKEYPCKDTAKPYYPVYPEGTLASRYKTLCDKEKHVHFGGRLAEYKYYDMDKVIEKALRDSEYV